MKTKNLLTSILKSCLALFITGNAVAQCSAAFTSVGNYTNNCNTFQFTNTSTVTPGSVYKWEFGDGATTSMGAPVNVYHTYTANGVYTATLSVYTTTTSSVACSTVSNTLSVNCGTLSCQSSFASIGSGTFTCNQQVFNNMSTPGLYYHWIFGDGYSTYTSSPYGIMHTYATANNTYTATLEVYPTSTSTAACSVSSQTVSVNCGTMTPCIADFTAAGNYTSNCNTFEFINTSSSPGPGSYYKWQFGDGATQVTASNGNVYHTYNVNGVYTPTLSVYSSTASSIPCSTVSNTLSVNCGTTCPASFSYTSSSHTANFNITSGSGMIYVWSFGDASGMGPTTNTTANHYYNNYGNYVVTLNVYSPSNTVTPCGSSSQSITISAGTVCQAAYTYTNGNCWGVTLVNNSTGTGNNYFWDFGDGTTSTTSSLYFTHQYTANGSYVIKLDVYSPSNTVTPCSSTQNTFAINCASLTCQAAYSYTSNANCNGAFFVNNSTGAGNTYFWDFGDGTTNITTSSAWFAHYFPANGSYVVKLDVYSPSNTVTPCSSIQHTLSINCATLACQANSQFTLFADTANAGNYFAYNSSTGNGTLSYLWNFGDGNTSTQQYPFHQYAVPGQYVVCLQVTSTTGTVSCSDTYCDSSSVHRMAAGFQMSSISVIPQTVTGIKQNELVKSLAAYPNPFNDELAIEVELNSNTSNISYEVYDALGKVVLKNKITDSKTILNTSALNNGFYFLSVKDENGNTLRSLKIVK